MSYEGRQRGGRATAAYWKSHGEHMIGICPNSQEYDEGIPTPTWDQLLNLLAREKIANLSILFCGKAGSDGGIGGTGFGRVTQRDVQRVINPYWGGAGQPSGPRAIARDPAMTCQLAHDLLGLNSLPSHITGIVVREEGR